MTANSISNSDSMKFKKVHTNIRLPYELKQKIDHIARLNRRSVTNVIEIVLEQALPMENGDLPPSISQQIGVQALNIKPLSKIPLIEKKPTPSKRQKKGKLS